VLTELDLKAPGGEHLDATGDVLAVGSAGWSDDPHTIAFAEPRRSEGLECFSGIHRQILPPHGVSATADPVTSSPN
jgi:hypothetical protein